MAADRLETRIGRGLGHRDRARRQLGPGARAKSSGSSSASAARSWLAIRACCDGSADITWTSSCPSAPIGCPCRGWSQAVRERERERYPDARFNLAKMLVGAEGTLATVTEALVHLVPLAGGAGRAGLAFFVAGGGDRRDRCGSWPAIRRQPNCSTDEIVRLAEKSLEYRHYLDFVVGRPESLLLVEFSGDTRGDSGQGRRAGLPAARHAGPAAHARQRSIRRFMPTFGPAARRRCRC